MAKTHVEMDHDEVLVLLQVAEMANAHGPSMVHIRNAALKRLAEIEKELAPPPPHTPPPPSAHKATLLKE